MKKKLLMAVLLGLTMASRPVWASQETDGRRLKELERKVNILTDEVQQLKMSLILPEDETKYVSIYGLGPAASKIYQINKGLSIGGYGEAYYRSFINDRGTNSNKADNYRFVLYTGYKFSKNLLLNAEIEFEHATTGSNPSGKTGSASVEFAYLDFLFSDRFNARAGMLLVPVGFINEMHEPTTFHGNIRPEVERQIIPTTWREMGAGIFGKLTPRLDYRLYVVNSLDAEGYSKSGIRGGRQKGNQTRADDLALSGRLDYTPMPGWTLGTSFFAGEAGQGHDFNGKTLSVMTTVADVHSQFHYRGLELRGLAVMEKVGDSAELSQYHGETIGKEMFGWYAEAAYDVISLISPDSEEYLAPFIRYERYNPHEKVPAGYVADGSLNTELLTMGVTYKPHPQVALKADYRNFEIGEGQKGDEINLGIGFIF